MLPGAVRAEDRPPEITVAPGSTPRIAATVGRSRATYRATSGAGFQKRSMLGSFQISHVRTPRGA